MSAVGLVITPSSADILQDDGTVFSLVFQGAPGDVVQDAFWSWTGRTFAPNEALNAIVFMHEETFNRMGGFTLSGCSAPAEFQVFKYPGGAPLIGVLIATVTYMPGLNLPVCDIIGGSVTFAAADVAQAFGPASTDSQLTDAAFTFGSI